MNSPFNFRVAIKEKDRLKRRLLYTVTALALLIAFTAGFLTVYVNSYNILHAEPMEVFAVYESDGGVSIVFLNRLFELS